jgi:hypothetical protein|tara:strand:- start:600 stop:809 length:210 start_codon:yes stop_codon:yes gene_type:complete
MNLDSDRLTPFQENELQWLRQQVDRLQDNKYKTTEDADIQKLNLERNLWVAREELDVFVKNLRKAGKKI